MSVAEPEFPPIARPWHPAWVLLIATVTTLALGYWVWGFTRARTIAQARVELEHRVSQIDIKIRERMQDYAYALAGMSTLFTGEGAVTRVQWRHQYRLLRVEEKYPGFQGIGYAQVITHAATAAFEQALRAEGFTDARVRPPGERDVYALVKFLEPAIERHVRAVGRDMYYDPARRGAMDFARDQGRAVITGKLTLQMEDADDQQPGFLMYLPVYRSGAAIATEAERRDAIEGYVFSTFRTLNLMRGILDEVSDIRIEIFDGRLQQEETRLYDSVQARGAKPPATAPLLQSLSAIPVHSRVWSLRVSTMPEFESRISTTRPMIATAYTVAVCLLLFGLIWLLYTRRQHALQLAGRMNSELAESRERLSLALDGSNLALFDWNVVNGQVRLSERWNAILGGAPQPTDITIQAFEQMVHGDDVERLVAQLQGVLQGKLPRYQVEHRVKAHDGTWRWVLNRGKIMERDAQGRVLRLVGTLSDITRRKDMEHMKNEFVASVSRELHAPLAELMESLEQLRQGAAGPMPGDARPLLDRAHQNGERLSALVNNMLDLEQLESGHLAFHFERISVAALLADAVAAHAAVARQAGTHVEAAPPPQPLTVIADRERTLQVLGRLLSNATKFAPAGSTITVAATPAGQHARIAVTDHGPGVPAELAGRVFSRFAQADSTAAREKGGAGLGLAVCKMIVDNMNGQIGYSSTPASGTTFYIELPTVPTR